MGQWGFPGSSDGKEVTCSAGDPSSIPESGRSPGEENDTHTSILAWRIPWTEEPDGLQSTGQWSTGHDWVTDTHTSGPVVKTLPVMQETQWPLGLEDPMEKGMATQSSILGWRIPWKEEPGGLQFMGSQRIRHDWATSTFPHSDCLGPLSFLSLNQGKVALSCCVSVYRPARWVRDTHVYVHSFPDSLPIEVLTEHGAESPVLYGGFSLVARFKRGTVYLSITVSLFIPPCLLPFEWGVYCMMCPLFHHG